MVAIKPSDQFDYRTKRVHEGDEVKYKPVLDIRCECGYTFEFESWTRLPDNVVTKKMNERGWLIAKRNGQHQCPKCLGSEKKNQLANRFKVFEGDKKVPDQAQLVSQAEEELDRKALETQSLLDRHFPMQDTSTKSSKPSSSPIVIQSGISPELTLALVQAITGFTQATQGQTERQENLSAAVELLVEQSSTLISLNKQLINAVAQIVPTIQRGNEGLSSFLDNIARSIANVRPNETPDRAEPVLFDNPPPLMADRPQQPEPEPTIEEPVGTELSGIWLACSKPPSGKGKYSTFVRMPVTLAECLGWEDKCSLKIEMDEDTITLWKSSEGRNQFKKQSNSTMYVSTYALGETYRFMNNPIKATWHEGKVTVRLA